MSARGNFCNKSVRIRQIIDIKPFRYIKGRLKTDRAGFAHTVRRFQTTFFHYGFTLKRYGTNERRHHAVFAIKYRLSHFSARPLPS